MRTALKKSISLEFVVCGGKYTCSNIVTVLFFILSISLGVSCRVYAVKSFPGLILVLAKSRYNHP